MKCPKCKSKRLQPTVMRQSIFSELDEDEFRCRKCKWVGKESETIRMPLEIAASWLYGYIMAATQFDYGLFPYEVWSKEQSDAHVKFVAECQLKGVNPTHFADTIIEDYRAAMNLFLDDSEGS